MNGPLALLVLGRLGVRVSLRSDGEQLSAGPRDLLTESIRYVLITHKAEIVDLLRSEEPIRFPEFDRDILASEALKRSPEQALAGIRRCLLRYTDTGSIVWLRAAGDFAKMTLLHEEWMVTGAPCDRSTIPFHLIEQQPVSDSLQEAS